MAKPDEALNLALARLHRDAVDANPFPAMSVDLGAITPDSLGTAKVVANRFTCRVDAGRVARFRAAPPNRGVLVNLIDAEAGSPLQLLWALANVPLLTHVAETLAEAWEAKVRFIVPSDLSAAWRKALKPLRSRETSAKYPAGHHRLLPRATGLFKQPLVLDAVALTDLAHHAATGYAPSSRPVMIEADAEQSFRLVDRGTPLHTLAENNATLCWYAGPRLADRLVDSATPIGDDDLHYYRERRGERFSSPCIRCGACVEICPTRCDPVALLDLQAASDFQPRRAISAGLPSCIDCGLCTAVCPAAIELHHLITDLKHRTGEVRP